MRLSKTLSQAPVHTPSSIATQYEVCHVYVRSTHSDAMGDPTNRGRRRATLLRVALHGSRPVRAGRSSTGLGQRPPIDQNSTAGEIAGRPEATMDRPRKKQSP